MSKPLKEILAAVSLAVLIAVSVHIAVFTTGVYEPAPENTPSEVIDVEIDESTDPLHTAAGEPNPEKFIVQEERSFGILKSDAEVDAIRVLKEVGFTKYESDRLHGYVIPALNKTLGTACFETFWVARNLIQTNGKTRREVLEDKQKKTVGIELHMYYANNSTVGYTCPGCNYIKMNRKFHQSYSVCTSAGNLAHELDHKLGYGHDSNATSRRPYSVPYSSNEGFRVCCEETLPVAEKTNRYVCEISWRTLWGLIKKCKWIER